MHIFFIYFFLLFQKQAAIRDMIMNSKHKDFFRYNLPLKSFVIFNPERYTYFIRTYFSKKYSRV